MTGGGGGLCIPKKIPCKTVEAREKIDEKNSNRAKNLGNYSTKRK